MVVEPAVIPPTADAPAEKTQERHTPPSTTSSPAAKAAPPADPAAASSASPLIDDAQMGESWEALEAECQALEGWRRSAPPSAPPSPVREETRLLQEASDALAARSRTIDNRDDPRHPSQLMHRAWHFGGPPP